MPAELKRGMDHDLYTFSPFPDRVTLHWPQNKPLAVSVVLYLDYWELQTPSNFKKPPDVQGMWGHQFPDLRTYSYRLYGERIGVFRVLEAFQRHGIRATVAVGSEICVRYPELIQQCINEGHEIAAHGTHATRMITSQMSLADERAHIQQSVEAVKRLTGKKPVGWFGQYQNESTRTPTLLVEEGIHYVADWSNDEQPYWMNVGDGLVSLPLQTELDDMQVMWMRQRPPWSYPTMVEDAVNQLVMDGQSNARTLVLGLRSWLSGRPHHIRYLNDALWALSRRTDVWCSSASEIVQCFSQQMSRHR